MILWMQGFWLMLFYVVYAGKRRVHHGLQQISALSASNTRRTYQQILGGHRTASCKEEQVEELNCSLACLLLDSTITKDNAEVQGAKPNSHILLCSSDTPESFRKQIYIVFNTIWSQQAAFCTQTWVVTESLVFSLKLRLVFVLCTEWSFCNNDCKKYI